MIDRDIQYFDDPFRYVVIDNFFDEEDYTYCSNILDEKTTLGTGNGSDRSLKRKLKKDLHNYITAPDNRFAKYFELIDSLDIRLDKEKEYTQDYVFNFRVRDIDEDYPVHCENIYKAITVVVYMSEETNYGTELYDEGKNFVKEIKWKNNRAFIMSGFNNQKGKLEGNSTWHTYHLAPGKIRRTFFGHTLASMESIKAHSLYEDYYVKGYGNRQLVLQKNPVSKQTPGSLVNKNAKD